MARTGRENLFTFICLGFMGLYAAIFVYFAGIMEIATIPSILPIMAIVLIFTGCFLFGWLQLAINGMLNKIDQGGKKKFMVQQYTPPQPQPAMQATSQFFQTSPPITPPSTQAFNVPRTFLCPHCHKELDVGTKFCGYCGGSVR